MRKPIEPQTDKSVADAVSVETYELETAPTGALQLFDVNMPRQYRVHEATFFKAGNGGTGKNDVCRLLIRVRGIGSRCIAARFLVVRSEVTQLPHIEPSPQDPPDTPMLQWSFWQGCRVGGGLYHDVFDVTHLKLEIAK